VCPKEGLIFGWHNYREYLKAAAEQVLPPERAKRFAGSHLRSARITHLAESSQNLPGVQFIVGHPRKKLQKEKPPDDESGGSSSAAERT
jgi:hypothetical protein